MTSIQEIAIARKAYDVRQKGSLPEVLKLNWAVLQRERMGGISYESGTRSLYNEASKFIHILEKPLGEHDENGQRISGTVQFTVPMSAIESLPMEAVRLLKKANEKHPDKPLLFSARRVPNERQIQLNLGTERAGIGVQIDHDLFFMVMKMFPYGFGTAHVSTTDRTPKNKHVAWVEKVQGKNNLAKLALAYKLFSIGKRQAIETLEALP